MGRAKRLVGVGYPHHVTHRGNNRQKVFLDDKDCWKYLSLLAKYCHQYKLIIISYCLMPNHVHFIAVPGERYSLAKACGCAHTQYARYSNRKRGACGHLWQYRFYSCLLDQRHLLAAARYIERNPVRAGIVKEAWEWEWSSARYHLGLENRPEIIQGNLFDYVGIGQKQWMDFLKKDDEKETIDKLRKYTKVGLPLGTFGD
ncbi:MAG: transposase [Candidatus Saganbacteria bacterium]|nr:transposase [Candidatus Saganbacteria bacterium]